MGSSFHCFDFPLAHLYDYDFFEMVSWVEPDCLFGTCPFWSVQGAVARSHRRDLSFLFAIFPMTDLNLALHRSRDVFERPK
jgi:hypothetical protein